jgi:TorA-specific chaperone
MDERVTDLERTASADLPRATIARNRAALYRWFARLFFTPAGEAEVIDLRAGPMRAVLDSLAMTPGAAEPVAAICRALDHGSAESVAASLGIARTRLFDGIGGYRTTPPYRSMFTSGSGLLCQEATAEMERVLRRHQLKLDANVREPADHLSLQIEVMSQLALRAAETEAAGGAAAPLLIAQADFVDQQLLDWVPRFAERLAAVDELGFHAGLAAVLVLILQQDRAYLAELIDHP